MLFSTSSLALVGTLFSLVLSTSAAALPTDTTSPALSSLQFDKRQVAVCTRANQCPSAVPANSVRSCVNNTCGFRCRPTFVLIGGACVPNTCDVSTCPRSTIPRSVAACVENECSFRCKAGNKLSNGACVPNALCTTSSCPTPAFAKYATCPNDVCGFVCFAGYRPENGACVLKAPTCGPNTCVGVTNGVTSCSAGACTYTCRTGFTYAAVAGQPTCLDLEGDVANCGAVGNTCDSDYTGSGTAYCKGGSCDLNCPTGQTPTMSSPPFCSA